MGRLGTDEAISLLIRLHAYKNQGYGDAWRKRGELVSIFPNLARKYDRLVVALDEGTDSSDERLLDTAGDLCVYACKYLTWLADEHAGAFDTASPVSATSCADDGGTGGLDHVLGALSPSEAATDVGRAWTALKVPFAELDHGLTAQASGEPGPAWERKVQLSWAIAERSTELLVALAERESQDFADWRDEIERMG